MSPRSCFDVTLQVWILHGCYICNVIGQLPKDTHLFDVSETAVDKRDEVLEAAIVAILVFELILLFRGDQEMMRGPKSPRYLRRAPALLQTYGSGHGDDPTRDCGPLH